MAGIFSTFSPKLVPTHIGGMSGDSPAGSPEGALQYVAEGAFTTTQYNPETFPLTEALKAKGITEEQWVEICTALRKGKGMTGMGGGFSKAISQVPAASRAHALPTTGLLRLQMRLLPACALPCVCAQANVDFFDKLGLIGAYAEYHKGQKAMVVFPKEAVELGRIKMP